MISLAGGLLRSDRNNVLKRRDKFTNLLTAKTRLADSYEIWP